MRVGNWNRESRGYHTSSSKYYTAWICNFTQLLSPMVNKIDDYLIASLMFFLWICIYFDWLTEMFSYNFASSTTPYTGSRARSISTTSYGGNPPS